MAILKCKMCGGNLEIQEGVTVCECEYCGSKQTVPTGNDEKRLTLYERANRLRFNCEFDKAETVYESIVEEFHEEAEAYWGLVLCKYGIEYVDDPATGKKVPTCHRSSFDSVMDDSDFEMVMENADTLSRQVYREQAKRLEEIRKGIIEVSGKEEPYDIFICYKETAENGERTIDSVLAQDVYDALTEKGYRVFFSRITLEDKLGTEYEPYIFAALNSAKIMLAFGTSYDYYNAVWVKNEWSRYLKLMAADKSRHLIPCYKNLDAYDIPKEFAKLQAQDMGKVGAMQDLLRGINKILPKDQDKTSAQEVVVVSDGNSANVASYLKRVSMFLEDGNWNSANEYCEKVLDIDPENAEAYLGKLMAEQKVSSQERLKDKKNTFENSNSYQKAYRFGNDKMRELLENATKTIIYNDAINKMKKASSETEYKEIAALFDKMQGFSDADSKAQECYEKAEISRKDTLLQKGVECKNTDIIGRLEKAIDIFSGLDGWKNSQELLEQCKVRIAEIKDATLMRSIEMMKEDNIDSLKKAIEELEKNKDWKNSSELLNQIKGRIKELKEKEKKEKEEAEQKKQEMELQRQKTLERIEIIAKVSNVIFHLFFVGLLFFMYTKRWVGRSNVGKIVMSSLLYIVLIVPVNRLITYLKDKKSLSQEKMVE